MYKKLFIEKGSKDDSEIFKEKFFLKICNFKFSKTAFRKTF